MKRAPKQHPRPDLSAWWNKETTAAALNVSTKTVERLAAAAKLESRMYKRPEGGAVIKVYHPAEVERLRKKLQPDAKPFVVPAETSALVRTTAAPAPAGPAAGWERALAVQIAKAGQLFLEAEHHPPELPVTEVLFLTLQQAAKLSGLPRSLIREMKGVRTGRGWRIRRADLEALTVSDVIGLEQARRSATESEAYKMPRVSQAEIDARHEPDPDERITGYGAALVLNPLDRAATETAPGQDPPTRQPRYPFPPPVQN